MFTSISLCAFSIYLYTIMAPKPKSPRKTRLPVYKVKNLMKSKDKAQFIGYDAAFVMTVAAELFITLLAEEAFHNSVTTEIDYKHLAEVIHKDERYKFLREVIPTKITVREYKELMENMEKSQISEEDLEFYLK